MTEETELESGATPGAAPGSTPGTAPGAAPGPESGSAPGVAPEPTPESAPEPTSGVSKKKPLSPKQKLIIAVAALIVAAVAWIGVQAFLNSQRTTRYTSSSELTKIVTISKLSSAQYVYNGIAEKYNDKGEVAYRIAYKAKVKVGIDMTAITFDVDNEKMTVTPKLPPSWWMATSPWTSRPSTTCPTIPTSTSRTS